MNDLPLTSQYCMATIVQQFVEDVAILVVDHWQTVTDKLGWTWASMQTRPLVPIPDMSIIPIVPLLIHSSTSYPFIGCLKGKLEVLIEKTSVGSNPSGDTINSLREEICNLEGFIAYYVQDIATIHDENERLQLTLLLILKKQEQLLIKCA